MGYLSEDDKRIFATIASDLRTDGVGGADNGRMASSAVVFVVALACLLLTLEVTLVAFGFFLLMLLSTVRVLQTIDKTQTVTRAKALMDRALVD